MCLTMRVAAVSNAASLKRGAHEVGLRLIRVGPDASQVGADVRVALTALSRQDSVAGGIVLTGVRSAGLPRPVDAIAVLPRGVLIFIGIELPDPALRLDAPLGGEWKADGWPLGRPDGAVNPAVEALQLADMVLARVRAAGLGSTPVSTVLAVGPYVEAVTQPPEDLSRGVRIVHPSATNLLQMIRELATGQQPCPVEPVQRLVREFAPDHPSPGAASLAGEGFTDTVPPELANADTRLLPKITPPPAGGPAPQAPAPAATPRWLPIGAVALIGLLLVAGVVVAVTSGGSGARPAASGERPGKPSVKPAAVRVNGISFNRMAANQHDSCAPHAFGDLAAALQKHDCTKLLRAEFETTVDGRVAVLSISVVLFGDERDAKGFQQVAQVPGSGGIKALRARHPNQEYIPQGAAFGTAQRDNKARLVQSAWRDGQSTPDDQKLINLVESARELPVPAE